MLFEFIKFLVYSSSIVILSKAILVPTVRSLAEELKLKAKTIGELSGCVTSMPELLTIIASSSKGLLGTGFYNILSSNMINVVLYFGSIFENKNFKRLKNKAIIVILLLVLTTILIPCFLIYFNVTMDIKMIIIFILLFILYRICTRHVHNLYLMKEEVLIEVEITKEGMAERKNNKKAGFYFLILIVVGISLFLISEKLSITLENLCLDFNIPQFIIGFILGFITSIPELITFFESQEHHKKTNKMLGVVETTNNLLISNMLNLFIIQSIGAIIYMFVT